MDLNPNKDKDSDEYTNPGIPVPGKQSSQKELPGAPPQPQHRHHPDPSRWIPPISGNPDLDPAGSSQQRIDLRDPTHHPLTPQGMLFDPSQLRNIPHGPPLNPYSGVPEGARFDPYGPPGPLDIGPHGRPVPSSNFADPDPDHFQLPGALRIPLGKTTGKSVLKELPRPPFGPGGGGSGSFGGGFSGPFI